VRFMSL
jgi:hypothetical protein